MKVEEIKKLTKSGRVVNGALPSDSAAEFSILIPRSAGVTKANFYIQNDSGKKCICPLEWSEISGKTEQWKVSFAGFEVGLYYYRYEIVTAAGTSFWGGEDARNLSENQARQLLVYDKAFSSPKKLPGAMIYHIFVDRFCIGEGTLEKKKGTVTNDDWYGGIPQYGAYPGADVKNNEFFGGNLWGVIEKLQYIKSLGTDYIYLSPVFDAASNHKYDTGDYLSVDSMFGGDKALEQLIYEASKAGIGIILDGVFNHTGDDSVYFNRYGHYRSVGAYNSPDSVYSEWYNFKEWPDDYECWWGIKILPRVDSSNPDYKSFICDQVLSKWMDMGVSGWRLDVADELSDDFLNDFRSAVKINNPDALIIGEVWEDASNKEAYGKRRKYLQGRQLDSVMNYPFRDAVISYIKHGDCRKFSDIVLGICRRYPDFVLASLMNFLGTHDTARIITVLGGEDPQGHSNEELSILKMSDESYFKAVKQVICAFYLIGILPGALSVYYGDEIGMEGYGDPFCRRPFPWGNENESVLSVIRKIGEIRKNEDVFNSGEFSIIEINTDFAIVKRTLRNSCKTIVGIINRSEEVLNVTSSVEFVVLTDCQKETVRSIMVMPTDGAYIRFDCLFDEVELEFNLLSSQALKNRE